MKCKYKLRWFSSKRAFLVLLWTLLISIVIGLDYHAFIKSRIYYFSTPVTLILCLISGFVGFVSSPLSGWLADAMFGNYKVFRVGAILLFIDTVMNCVLLILEELLWQDSYVLKCVHLVLCGCLSFVGICACMLTALPLGLDQMPDASSSSIASYIAWFVCSIFVGGLFGEGVQLLKEKCMTEKMHSSFPLILVLLSVFGMSIVMASIFLFSPKWLIIEPKSPQSLKNIYRVLKFAVKHNAPLNRSALTYWEEDIPSRIDLGKSKYGGPFTTEQVEDVKTILRLLIISLPFAIIIISFTTLLKGGIDERVLGLTTCSMSGVQFFLKSYYWYGLLGVIANEFLIYPLARSKLPSILKRIGIVAFLGIIATSFSFTLALAHYLSQSNETTTEWIAEILHRSTGGVLFQFIGTLIIEFVCAQSPYNMRGLLLSTVMILVIASSSVQVVIDVCFSVKVCAHQWCFLVSYSVKLTFHTVGFLLFCVVARWYKVRVRDENFSTQRVVEEVYDRYLTAAAARSRSYGGVN